jgi:hypothetical protein
MKWLRLFHILTTSIWFGGVACIGVLTWICFFGLNQQEFLTVAPVSGLLFDKIILPVALITLAQGIIYSIFTNWGFIKHKWILIKWLGLILLVICTGTGSIDNMELVIEKVQTQGFVGGYSDGGIVLMFFLAQVVIMAIMIALSVFKPFGKKEKSLSEQLRGIIPANTKE